MEPLIFTLSLDPVNVDYKPAFVKDDAHHCGECSTALVMWPPANSEAEHGQTWRCERATCGQRFAALCEKNTHLHAQLMWHAVDGRDSEYGSIRNLMLPYWGRRKERFKRGEVCDLCGVRIVLPDVVAVDHRMFICKECTALCGLKDYTFPEHVALDRARLQ